MSEYIGKNKKADGKKSAEKALVSIIVPVYNVEKYILDTMDSVISQTYENWELLLVENGSTDKTKDLITQFLTEHPDSRIRLLEAEANIGAARARNMGLQAAKGRYIAYLDSDDYWMPEKLQREIAFAEENQAAFVFSGYEFVKEDGTRTGKIVRVPYRLNYRQALKNTTIFTSTVLFDTRRISRELLEMPVIPSEDTALWWKVLRNGYQAYGLDENLVAYRRPGKSLSSNKIKAIQRIWNLYRREEHLNIVYSLWNFVFWAFRAVIRRV